ncbi:hypothetical protein CIB43_00311 [Mesomycoplasma hyopneumoniae]|uniref:Uncharacterized protein n=1 Tax=Mesomycoplasma hyopneumoniae TaxID=2099 RepID=A0A223M9H9_MESHO|nr:hypothetical protein CIB43_00311 [Mesomycoplasma hyopneumoniae]
MKKNLRFYQKGENYVLKCKFPCWLNNLLNKFKEIFRKKIEKEINSLNSLLNSTNSWIDDSYKNSIKSQIIKKEMIISQLKNKNKESSHE